MGKRRYRTVLSNEFRSDCGGIFSGSFIKKRFFEKMKTHFAEFGYGLWMLEAKQAKKWVGFT
ncbi:hypothetical protein DQM68_01140 [Leptospira mayottensis]|uniref:Uncharacterized protein n=2 Tax=Leptospira mayottensis TaxID=1137606 RepID=A0AA87MJT8_9LEPT|nr:hypothetical protein DQM68_01140 [Leptospira mayottensis]AXR63308.1 hypothetical protein DQM28_02785 [Leptospira mayottensis]AZQ01158.1 hypothetical protein LEP1GSC190_02845 [Leptospira mayottensis 200901116]EKR98162.1 hypothetical protein LEP1GSC125_1041 [Leptospira mayottensis 200901122]TGN06438.1 hypothetical protein EHR03_10300 [Leptospira mayottensis]